MWSRETRQLIEAACEEDLGPAGDITSALIPEAHAQVAAAVVPREPGVIVGLALGPSIGATYTRRLGTPVEFVPSAGLSDGAAVEAGATVAVVRGRHAAVLTVERTLLNFLGRMSGVATLARRYVEAARAANRDVRVLDTRKTIPGWRELDKYAVRCGGGHNHRNGLYDAILIKDNHLAGIPVERLADELTEMLSLVSPSAALANPERDPADAAPGAPDFIEVEVDGLAQFEQVCQVSAVDVVLLDNFTLADMRAAVHYRDRQGLRGKLRIEVSGGVRLETIAEIAATGIDRISVGALTHSAPSLDIGLDL